MSINPFVIMKFLFVSIHFPSAFQHFCQTAQVVDANFHVAHRRQGQTLLFSVDILIAVDTFNVEFLVWSDHISRNSMGRYGGFSFIVFTLLAEGCVICCTHIINPNIR